MRAAKEGIPALVQELRTQQQERERCERLAENTKAEAARAQAEVEQTIAQLRETNDRQRRVLQKKEQVLDPTFQALERARRLVLAMRAFIDDVLTDETAKQVCIRALGQARTDRLIEIVDDGDALIFDLSTIHAALQALAKDTGDGLAPIVVFGKGEPTPVWPEQMTRRPSAGRG